MSSSSQDFHAGVSRVGTNSYKWDLRPSNSAGVPMLPMWVADMDFAAPLAVREAIAGRVEHPVYGYTFASDAYWQALTEWQRSRNGFEVDRSWMVYVPGVMPAVRAAILAFAGPGESVVVQPPVYFPFFSAIRDNGRKVVENPLVETSGGYRMDLEQLESVITPSTRVVLLCSPHNPVGRVWTASELRELGDLCIRHDLVVVSDEIHCDIRRPGVEFRSFAALGPEYASRAVVCQSPSKTFNLAGLASATAIVPDERLRERLKATLARLGMTLPNILSLEAARAAYEHGSEWTDSLLAYLDEQIGWYAAELQRRFAPDLILTPIQGTYLAWLDFRPLMRRSGRSHDDVRHALLEEAALWLSDGREFGTGGEGFFRMNLGTPRRLVEDGLARLERAVRFLESGA